MLDFPNVHLYKSGIDITRYPYPISHKMRYLSDEWADAIQWIETNVGKRGTKWEWQVSNTFMFLNNNDATLFALTWIMD